MSKIKLVGLPDISIKKCLVCYKNFVENSDLNGFKGENLSLVKKQLNVIFILGNLLQVPLDRLQKYLKANGNPNEWGVWICSKCQIDFKAAIEIHEELVKITKTFKQIQAKIIETIRESSGSTGKQGRSKAGVKLNVADESRSFACQNTYSNLQNPFKDDLLIKSEKEQDEAIDADYFEDLPLSPPSMENDERTASVISNSVADHSGQVDLTFDIDEDQLMRSEGVYFSYTKTNKFRCLKCKLIIGDSSKFISHLKLHKHSSHKCTICERVFNKLDNYQRHLEKVHKMTRIRRKVGKSTEQSMTKKREKKCPVCLNYRFNMETPEQLCTHLETCAKAFTKPLSCPFCNFECGSEEIAVLGTHLLNCQSGLEDSSTLSKRIFRCSICPEYFQFTDFIGHFQDHLAFKLRCVICLRGHSSELHALQHSYSSHRKDPTPYKERFKEYTSLPEVNWLCPFCPDKFLSEDERDSHLNSKHPNEELKKLHACPTCSKAYSCPYELKLHKGITHMMDNFQIKDCVKCDLCPHICRTLEIEKHKRKEHKVNLLVCEHCGMKFAGKNVLKQHLDRHQEVKKYACDKCPMSFITHYLLDNHKYSAHTAPDSTINPLVCKYCNKLFSSPSFLKTHVNHKHENIFRLFCHLCDFGTSTQTLLENHLSSKHKIPVEKKYKCDIPGCTKKFRRPRELKNHKSMHAGTPKYFCSHCGKGFYDRNGKIRHERIHTNAESRPHKCKICGKGFPLTNYLTVHMKSHRNK